MLLQKAIGDQLTCIFVDHGLLRKGEAEQVMESLGGKFGLNIIKVDAKERFLSKLAGVSDPEQNVKSSVTNLCMFLMTKQLNLLGRRRFIPSTRNSLHRCHRIWYRNCANN